MNYYWPNRQESLQKAKKKYDNGGKEKAAEYYQANKDVIKEKANSKYKCPAEEEKKTKKSIARIDIKNEEKNGNLFL